MREVCIIMTGMLELWYVSLSILALVYVAILALVVASIWFYIKLRYHRKIVNELSKQEND